MQTSLLRYFPKEIQAKQAPTLLVENPVDVVLNPLNKDATLVNKETFAAKSPVNDAVPTISKLILNGRINSETNASWKKGDRLPNGRIFFRWDFRKCVGPFVEGLHFRSCLPEDFDEQKEKEKHSWRIYINDLDNLAKKLLCEAKRRAKIRNDKHRAQVRKMANNPELEVPDLGGVRNLTHHDIARVLRKGRCERTGLPFNLDHFSEACSKNRGARNAYRPSLDRVDSNNHWYEAGNVQVVCWTVNAARNRFDDVDTAPILACLSSSMILEQDQPPEIQAAAQTMFQFFQPSQL